METRSNYVMVGAVTMALLVGVLLFIVWLAGLSNKQTRCYDIYFAQGVGGLNKGSNVHYLLVKALERAGVRYADIQTVFLPPADARAAFERGAVDAWVIWDPFFAAAEKQLGARLLADGSGLVSNHQFYVASRGYAQKHLHVVQAIVEELARLDAWAEKNPKDVAALLAPQIGLPADITEIAAGRFAYGIKPISLAVAAEQQKIADTFFELKLIPKAIRIVDVLPAKTVAAK